MVDTSAYNNRPCLNLQKHDDESSTAKSQKRKAESSSPHKWTSLCTTPDSPIVTFSVPTSQSAMQAATRERKSNDREVRLLNENRELLKYKAEFEKIALEATKEVHGDRSLVNKQVLDRYAAKRSKSNAVKNNHKRKVRTIEHDRMSDTSGQDDESSSIDNDGWEVAPDLSKIFNEISEDMVDEEAEEMVEILNHRKKTRGHAEMLMEFDNGERVWTTVENAFTDGPLLVAAYIAANNLHDSAFEPKQMKKGKTDKAAVAQVEQKKCSREEKTNNASVAQVEQKKCSHDDYRTEIGGYRPEGDSRYFVMKYGLGNCFCAVCQTKFVPVGTTSKDLLFFRPSITKPAYMCVNRSHGCTHGVCYDCFMINGVSSQGLETRCRSTRQTNSNN